MKLYWNDDEMGEDKKKGKEKKMKDRRYRKKKKKKERKILEICRKVRRA